MIKRISLWLLIISIIFNFPVDVAACNEEQSNEYVMQILFGDDVLNYDNSKEVDNLLSALFICSVQSNQTGQEKLNVLKTAKISGIPSLNEINVSESDLLRCSHNAWGYVTKGIEKKQEERKEVLRKTVAEVCEFSWIDKTFKRTSGKIDSFSAFLYYSHILADYIAADSDDSEFSAKGYDIPAYSGVTYIELNGNTPAFSVSQKKTTDSYVKFDGLDGYGRTGVAIANIGEEILAPADSRLDIGNIKPSGWKQEKYEGLVNSKPPYIYNRCHLIAHQLVNVDKQENLITGTRYLNEAMIPFENEVISYVKETKNHVLYRATPVYVGDNLVASGVQLEGYSVEDNGKGICFNVYLYNVQPGINIDYANGNTEQSDQIYGSDNSIPFAIVNPNDENPDLMYEIRKELEIIFEDQKESNEYNNMLNDLALIESEARNSGGNNEASMYIALKKHQYDYLKTLSEYVPQLLKNEKFFDVE